MRIVINIDFTVCSQIEQTQHVTSFILCWCGCAQAITACDIFFSYALMYIVDILTLMSTVYFIQKLEFIALYVTHDMLEVAKADGRVHMQVMKNTQTQL